MMQSDVDHEVVGAGDLAGVHGTRKRELGTLLTHFLMWAQGLALVTPPDAQPGVTCPL